jgi:hypothetical protein
MMRTSSSGEGLESAFHEQGNELSVSVKNQYISCPAQLLSDLEEGFKFHGTNLLAPYK